MRASLTDNNAVRFGFGQVEFGSYLCRVPNMIKSSYRHTVQAYLGTDDAQQLAAYEQSMQLLTLFYTVIYLAKGKDSKNLTPERPQGVLTQILPQFRQMAPMIRQMVQEFQC